MKRLSDVDFNFAKQSENRKMVYADAIDHPDLICGLLIQEGCLIRLEDSVACRMNQQVASLRNTTAGGRLRFYTDSSSVSLRVTLGEVFSSSNLSNLAAAGFDVYERQMDTWEFCGCVPPNDDLSPQMEGTVQLLGDGEHEVLIHFPLYAQVKALQLGLEPGTSVRPAPYRGGSFVIYGSSITQGGCASRPGTAFVSVVSRKMDMDYRNLGFSSGARGERAMAEYLLQLPCDAMILDYDHNAPSAAYLAETYEPFYRCIRQARPDLPIVLASAPVAHPERGEWTKRRDIIRAVYESARARGERVRFLDGSQVFPAQYREECMADQWHPADLGMAAIADKLCAVLRDCLAEVSTEETR